MTRPAPVTLGIVDDNGLRRLERPLPSTHASRHAFAEIVLVGEISTEGSVALVGTRLPAARIVRVDRNDARVATCDAGLAATPADHFGFVDSDVMPEPGCAAKLAAALAAHPRAAVAPPRILHPHEPGIVEYDGAHDDDLGLVILRRRELPGSRAETEDPSWDGGVSAAFRVAGSRLEGERFDPSFFIGAGNQAIRLRLRPLGTELTRAGVERFAPRLFDGSAIASWRLAAGLL